MAKGGNKKGVKLSKKQKAYLGAEVWVHGKGGKVNRGASKARNRKVMASRGRKAAIQQYGWTKKATAKKRAGTY